MSVAFVECEWKPEGNPLQDRTAFEAVIVAIEEYGTRPFQQLRAAPWPVT